MVIDEILARIQEPVNLVPEILYELKVTGSETATMRSHGSNERIDVFLAFKEPKPI